MVSAITRYTLIAHYLGVPYETCVRVSSQRPSRSPTHKWGYETLVPFSWRPSLLAATHTPRPGRKIGSSFCCPLFSWPFLQ